MTTKEETAKSNETKTASNAETKTVSIVAKDLNQENMTKIEKMTNCIIEKFGVRTNIFKSGGCWSVMLENGHNVEGSKMKEIREYVISHSEELEEDDST